MNRLFFFLAGMLVAAAVFFQWKIAKDLELFAQAQTRYQDALVTYREQNIYYTPWRTTQWIVNRQNPAGYFVTNPDMLFEPSQLNQSTLRITRYAVITLRDLNGLDKINRRAVAQFVLNLYQPRVYVDGERSGEKSGAGFAAFSVLPGKPPGVRPTMDALIILDALGLLRESNIDLERVRNFILAHRNADGGFWDEHYPGYGRTSTLKCTSFAVRALRVLEPYLGPPLTGEIREGIGRFVKATFDPETGGFGNMAGARARDAYDAFRAFIAVYDTAAGNASARREAVRKVIDMKRLVNYLFREHYLKESGVFSRYRSVTLPKPSIKATHLVVWMLNDMRMLDRLDKQRIARYVASLESANGQYGGDIYTTYSAIGLFQKLGVPTEPLPEPEKPVMREAVPSYVPVTFFLAALVTLVLGHQINKQELEHINRALSRQASMDGLTGVFNRQKFESELETQLDIYRQYRHPFSIIMFDVDKFKSINDDFGHLAGDQVLKEVAERVGCMLRNGDVFARWGGEEFAVLLPETDCRGAGDLAEKLRLLLEESSFSIERSVTASFGVAEVRENDDEASLTDRADRAMMLAKQQGRNRVCILTAEIETVIGIADPGRNR